MTARGVIGSAGLVLVAALATTSCKRDKAPNPAGPAASSASAPASALSSAAQPAAKPARPAPLRKDYLSMNASRVAATPHGSAVLLVAPHGTSALPIFVGETEGLSIRMRLEHREFSRPLTHDLFDAALGRMNGKVVEGRIDKLEDGVFHGTLVIADKSGKRFELDARSSDVVAMALGAQLPIFVHRSVVERAAVDLKDLPEAPPAQVVPADPAGQPVSL